MFDNGLTIFPNVRAVQKVARIELNSRLVCVHSQFTLAGWIMQTARNNNTRRKLKISGYDLLGSCDCL